MGQGGLGGLRASARRSGRKPDAHNNVRWSDVRWDPAHSPDPDEWLGEVAFPELPSWDPIEGLGPDEGLEPGADLDEVLAAFDCEEPEDDAGSSETCSSDSSLDDGYAGDALLGVATRDLGDARALQATELAFDADEWRAASERYLAQRDSQRLALEPDPAETARLDARPTRALPRVESERREATESRATSTGPTRRIARGAPSASASARPSTSASTGASASASHRAQLARSATARLAALGPVPAAHPASESARRPRWGEVVRRPSFNVSQGRMARAWALTVSWPRLGASEAPRSRLRAIPLEVGALALLCLGLGGALGTFLLVGTPGSSIAARGADQAQPAERSASASGRKASTASAIQVRAPGGSLSSPSSSSPSGPAESALGAAVGGAASVVGPAEGRTGGPLALAGLTEFADAGDARARRLGARRRARLLEAEELLGAAGGVRLDFGLACGELGGRAFVPLLLERSEDAAPSARLSCEVRHDARLSLIAVHLGPAAREAAASVTHEVPGKGRLTLRLEGGRELGSGQLCVIELAVPASGLPSYLPLEAVSLALAPAAGAPLTPRLGAGACGALLLE